MSIREARELLNIIEGQLGIGKARIHRIGSGEHIVRIKRGDWWCWNPSDYVRYPGHVQKQGIYK